MKAEGGCKQSAEMGWRGGIGRIVPELLANATQWHFAEACMTSRVTDELTKGCVADDKLHNFKC